MKPSTHGPMSGVVARTAKLLHLDDAPPLAVVCFFGLYALLFTTLSLADGLSITMFVKRVGVEALPTAYGAAALLNVVVIATYSGFAERIARLRMMLGIIAGMAISFLVIWIGIRVGGQSIWYGALFACREVIFALLLVHFGTFLQDYFTRAQLSRALPVIYAGGRVGGIFGGMALAGLARGSHIVNLLGLCVALSLVAGLMAALMSRRLPAAASPVDLRSDASLHGCRGKSAQDLDRMGCSSMRGFVRAVVESPLLFWNTVTALVYVGCRWVLNYQYNVYFDQHFTDEAELARMWGLYTQVALASSLVIQLLVVGRLVSRIGLKPSTMVYAGIVAVCMGLNTGGVGVIQAVFSRYVETELRFGLRNPLNQILINKFSKQLRTRVRAMSIGVVVPVGTLVSSSALGLLVGNPVGVASLGAALGLAYFGGSLRTNKTYEERFA